MITLHPKDLVAISQALACRIDLYKKLANYNDYYPKRVKELQDLRDRINEAKDEMIERGSIQIACKL